MNEKQTPFFFLLIFYRFFLSLSFSLSLSIYLSLFLSRLTCLFSPFLVCDFLRSVELPKTAILGFSITHLVSTLATTDRVSPKTRC